VASISSLARTFDRGERRRLGGFMALVALLHVVGWGGMLLFIAPRYPLMLGLAGLAYTFGLRHAFDADHIAAIDNTTRKLMQDGNRPMGVGFFFSLGHSTVVFLIALALGLAIQWIVLGITVHGALREFGALLGTSVSGLFLVVIGVLNLLILLDIIKLYAHMKRGHHDKASLEEHLRTGGLLTRIFGRLFRVIRASWQMYPIGFLFGLGFDTASEVALLAISAAAVANHMPLLAVLSLPVIFAAGMSLMDTADGAFMSKAYAWAFANPIRKVFYNMTITGLSVFVALFVGVVELLQILIARLGLTGLFWDQVAGLDFGSMGFIIVGTFIATWIVAVLVYRVRRIEEKWAERMEHVRATG
jgi:high-affinity nickel-transport protein